MAKSSLLESQNHLIDALDKGHITGAVRAHHDAMAQEVIHQVDGWREYLLSSDALRNVKAIRERRARNRNRNFRVLPPREPRAR